MTTCSGLAALACALAACTTSPTLTTPATLAITPDTAPLARSIQRTELSAYVAPLGDAWQVVLVDAPAGTPCTGAPAGPGSLTFFVPTVPPLASPADGSTAEPIDVAVASSPFGPDPHAELDLAVATRETVGALYFFAGAAGFRGTFDATTTSDTGEMHVTGTFDAPICDAP